MTKLQNPMKDAFDTIVNDDSKKAISAHKNLGKALDRHFPTKSLLSDHDAMADHASLINRAIAMHLLREGQFSVASTFLHDVEENTNESPYSKNASKTNPQASNINPDAMEEDGTGVTGDEIDVNVHAETGVDIGGSPSATTATPGPSDNTQTLSSVQSQELQEKFSDMYRILQEIKRRNLMPAIDWARSNSVELEARGSNLEFELSKLQYIWLFKGSAVNGLPDDEGNGRAGALAYARQYFGRFQSRHLRDIDRLAGAMAFATNIANSPYSEDFAIDGSFSDVAASFTREFCSLLGLSAESPLYIAATAGTLALPQLVKYTTKTRTRGTEWTTSDELPFETPLPARMMYHSIFVCPVLKGQTTESNPPMMIPCGHVLAKETLHNLVKNSRFKCPYCPSEGQMKDARQIYL